MCHTSTNHVLRVSLYFPSANVSIVLARFAVSRPPDAAEMIDLVFIAPPF